MKKNHFPPCGRFVPYAIIRTVAHERDIRGRKNERNGEMKKLGNYIDNHPWAQVAVCAVIVGVFWGIAEIGFRLIHGVAL